MAQQQFGDAFVDMRQGWLAKLQDQLDPTGPLVTNAIKTLREVSATPEQLVEAAPQIQQDWLAITAEQAGHLQHEFAAGVETGQAGTDLTNGVLWKCGSPSGVQHVDFGFKRVSGLPVDDPTVNIWHHPLLI